TTTNNPRGAATGERRRGDGPRRLLPPALLLNYAEFDTPVVAPASCLRAVAAAFRCPVVVGHCVRAAVALGAQHGGVNPGIDEDLSHRSGTPLRQLHIAGWMTGGMGVAANLNHGSRRQLLHQTGRLPQERHAARRNPSAIGSEINDLQMKGRLIRSAAR